MFNFKIVCCVEIKERKMLFAKTVLIYHFLLQIKANIVDFSSKCDINYYNGNIYVNYV